MQDLEKVFEGGVGARIRNERQSIVWQEFCVLAQDGTPSLQVLLEGMPPLVQFYLFLRKDCAWTGKQIYFGLSSNAQQKSLCKSFLHLKNFVCVTMN